MRTFIGSIWTIYSLTKIKGVYNKLKKYYKYEKIIKILNFIFFYSQKAIITLYIKKKLETLIILNRKNIIFK
jgi:hypothetical protein